MSNAKQIERLVDGELSPEEYRALLTALDEEPTEWRHCALAFLESQALGQELPQLRRSIDIARPDNVAGKSVTRADVKWDHVRMLLAVAASFVVALGLGLAAPSLYRLVKENHAGGNVNKQRPVLLVEDFPDEGAPQEERRYLGDVNVLVDGSAEGSEAAGRVPVYEVGPDVARYLASEAPALGPEMIELLRQHGYDVRHDQQLFPAPLDDGRQIIVPVEGYQITPVSRSY